MKLKRELTHVAAKVKGKLTRMFDHDQLETLGTHQLKGVTEVRNKKSMS